MREYRVACPDCLKMIEIEMDECDERRNKDGFFFIVCGHCDRRWYAKIFESLSVYPFKLIKEKAAEKKDTKEVKK